MEPVSYCLNQNISCISNAIKIKLVWFILYYCELKHEIKNKWAIKAFAIKLCSKVIAMCISHKVYTPAIYGFNFNLTYAVANISKLN